MRYLITPFWMCIHAYFLDFCIIAHIARTLCAISDLINKYELFKHALSTECNISSFYSVYLSVTTLQLYFSLKARLYQAKVFAFSCIFQYRSRKHLQPSLVSICDTNANARCKRTFNLTFYLYKCVNRIIVRVLIIKYPRFRWTVPTGITESGDSPTATPAVMYSASKMRGYSDT